jgi:hypothetical protein
MVQNFDVIPDKCNIGNKIFPKEYTTAAAAAAATTTTTTNL